MVLAVGLAAVVVTWGAVAMTLRHPKPVAASATPSSIVWSGRVFSDRSSLATWLRSRGSSYDAWAANHTRLASVIDPRVVVPAPKPKPVPAAARPATAHHLRGVYLEWALLAVAAAAAVAFGRRFVRRRPLRRPLRFALPRPGMSFVGPLRNRALTNGNLRVALRDNGLTLLVGAALVVGVGILIATSS